MYDFIIWTLGLIAGIAMWIACKPRAAHNKHKYSPYLINLNHKSILMLQCDCGIVVSADVVREELEIRQLERLVR